MANANSKLPEKMAITMKLLLDLILKKSISLSIYIHNYYYILIMHIMHTEGK